MDSIIIVDDDPIIIKGLKEQLSGKFNKPVEFYKFDFDKSELIKYLDEYPNSLVVLDGFGMWFEVARHINNTERVILFTSGENDENTRIAEELEITTVTRKNVDNLVKEISKRGFELIEGDAISHA